MEWQIIVRVDVWAEQRLYDAVNGLDEPESSPDGDGRRSDDHKSGKEISPETLGECCFGDDLRFNNAHHPHFALLGAGFKATLMPGNHRILFIPNPGLGLGL